MRPFSEWTKIVGRRGSCGSTPENTLMSIREAADVEARAVQFDVRLSADGVPVLLRDETLDRTTNATGSVWEKTLPELKQLDAGSWFLPQFAGEPIPTLQEALALCAALELRVLPELRPQPGYERETTTAVLDVIHQFWAFEQSLPLIGSTDPACLAAAAELQPDWPRKLIFENPTLPANWRDMIELSQATTLQGSANNPTALLELVARGKPVYASPVNDVKRARSLFAIGIFGIVTDYPAQMLFQNVQVRMPF